MTCPVRRCLHLRPPSLHLSLTRLRGKMFCAKLHALCVESIDTVHWHLVFIIVVIALESVCARRVETCLGWQAHAPTIDPQPASSTIPTPEGGLTVTGPIIGWRSIAYGYRVRLAHIQGTEIKRNVTRML